MPANCFSSVKATSVFFLLLLAFTFSQAAPVKIKYFGVKPLNADTLPYNIFYSLKWDIRVVYPDHSIKYFTDCKADSLLGDVDKMQAAILKTTFIADTSLLNKLFALKHSMKGSAKVFLNSQLILETGVFAFEK